MVRAHYCNYQRSVICANKLLQLSRPCGFRRTKVKNRFEQNESLFHQLLIHAFSFKMSWELLMLCRKNNNDHRFFGGFRLIPDDKPLTSYLPGLLLPLLLTYVSACLIFQLAVSSSHRSHMICSLFFHTYIHIPSSLPHLNWTSLHSLHALYFSLTTHHSLFPSHRPITPSPNSTILFSYRAHHDLLPIYDRQHYSLYYQWSRKAILGHRTFGPVNQKSLQDRTNFYRTEILCLTNMKKYI